MGELVAIIQGHLDRYGVTEATFARRMGVNPQTINAWRTRGGLKRLPERRILEAVARETRTPYEDVLQAALVDTGYAATVTPESVDALDREPAPQAEPAAVSERRSAPHSTPVTQEGIAAGTGFPRPEPGHRRSTRSIDTTSRRGTS